MKTNPGILVLTTLLLLTSRSCAQGSCVVWEDEFPDLHSDYFQSVFTWTDKQQQEFDELSGQPGPYGDDEESRSACCAACAADPECFMATITRTNELNLSDLDDLWYLCVKWKQYAIDGIYHDPNSIKFREIAVPRESYATIWSAWSSATNLTTVASTDDPESDPPITDTGGAGVCVMWRDQFFNSESQFFDDNFNRTSSQTAELELLDSTEDPPAQFQELTPEVCCELCEEDNECDLGVFGVYQTTSATAYLCQRYAFRNDPLSLNSQELRNEIVPFPGYSAIWSTRTSATHIPTSQPTASPTLAPTAFPTSLPTLVPVPSETPNEYEGTANAATNTGSGDILNTENMIAVGIFGGTAVLCLALFMSSHISQKRDLRSMSEAERSSWTVTVFPPEHGKIFFVGLALIDVGSDVLFAVERMRTKQSDRLAFGYLALGFLIGPFIVNVLVLLKIMRVEFNNQRMREWYGRNSVTGTLSFILACSNIEVVGLLHSKIFGSRTEGDRFFAPISIETQKNVFFYGLINNALEDIPQLIVQLWVLNLDGGTARTAILMIALVTSALGLFFGVFRRLCFVLAIHSEKSTSATHSSHSYQVDYDNTKSEFSRSTNPFTETSVPFSSYTNTRNLRSPYILEQLGISTRKLNLLEDDTITFKIELSDNRGRTRRLSRDCSTNALDVESLASAENSIMSIDSDISLPDSPKNGSRPRTPVSRPRTIFSPTADDMDVEVSRSRPAKLFSTSSSPPSRRHSMTPSYADSVGLPSRPHSRARSVSLYRPEEKKEVPALERERGFLRLDLKDDQQESPNPFTRVEPNELVRQPRKLKMMQLALADSVERHVHDAASPSPADREIVDGPSAQLKDASTTDV